LPVVIELERKATELILYINRESQKVTEFYMYNI